MKDVATSQTESSIDAKNGLGEEDEVVDEVQLVRKVSCSSK